MIGLKNQYVLKLDLGDYKDFVNTVDLIDFLYVEDSDMALPTVEVSFILRDLNVLNYLHEGSILTVGIGKDALGMLDMHFRVLNDFSTKKPSLGQTIQIAGLYYDYEFSVIETPETFKDMSSLEVVKELAGRHFVNIETNMDKTLDRQTWQKYSSPWDFLTDVCARGYISEKTFVVSGFDTNTFYYYDFKKLLDDAVSGARPYWVMSTSLSGHDNSSIINYNKAWITSDTGSTNRAIGFNATNYEYDWDTYEIKAYQDSLFSFLSIDTDRLPMPTTDANTSFYRHLTTNMHSNANRALSQNTRNQILSSNVQIFVSFAGQFRDIKLYDPILFDETADPSIVGFSVVTRIAYQVVDNKLVTNVTLVRESLNNIRGDLKQVGLGLEGV